jgi:hypothetical protein
MWQPRVDSKLSYRIEVIHFARTKARNSPTRRSINSDSIARNKEYGPRHLRRPHSARQGAKAVRVKLIWPSANFRSASGVLTGGIEAGGLPQCSSGFCESAKKSRQRAVLVLNGPGAGVQCDRFFQIRRRPSNPS